MPKTVVIAIDWSMFAENAFQWYVDNLHKEEDHYVILAHFMDASSEKDKKQKEKDLLMLQECYEQKMEESCHGSVEHEWVVGSAKNAGEFLMQVITRQNADMVVMGARGRNKLQKAILGSVSDHVLHKANIPVLICKAGSTEK